MDITPLYELRNRLRTAMIAGTNLLMEDFRLMRAVEAVKPLEQASPVFAKIGEMGRSLLDPEKEEKEGILLDMITLVDAVICTQGAVGISETVEPVEIGEGGTVVANAPYSILKALLKALTSSGSGHYSYVIDTHRDHPELFKDYRVKAAMVQALSAPYAELADCVAQWLKEEGEEILPLLQKGFNPRGKKDMVRRIQVMEAVAGAKANDFYISMLPKAVKEVRQALIYALRHSGDNVALLMELTKTERGNAKKSAYFALACNEDEKAEEFFRNLYEKNPAAVMEYLYLSGTDWASSLVAECLKEQLLTWKRKIDLKEQLIFTTEQEDLLQKSLRALAGKRGAQICEVYRIAAELGNLLDCPVEGTEKNFKVNTFGILEGYKMEELTFQNAVPYFLHLSICMNPDRELCAQAVKLYEGQDLSKVRLHYFASALAAKLLTEDDCCDWLEQQLNRRGLFARGKAKKELHGFLRDGLTGLCFDERTGQYVIRTGIYNGSDAQLSVYKQPVRQEITGRFTDILLNCKNSNVDMVFRNCINPKDESQCRKLEECFYNRALTSNPDNVVFSLYIEILKRCGCQRCDGLLLRYLQKKHVVLWHIQYFLNEMPGSSEAKVQEAMRALELIEDGKFKVYNWNKDTYMDMVEKLKY